MPSLPVAITAWLVPLIAYSVCWLTLKILMQRATHLPMDHPNTRSLHATPTPRVGGLGIIVALLIASIFIQSPILWPFMLGALILAVVSLLDDYKNLPVHWRLLAHVSVAVGCVLLLPHITGINVFVASLAVVWMTNLYNFMDGADGLAGGMAVIGFGALAVAAGWAGASDLAVFCGAIAAAALAFLRFNFPPAKIFMGDAGSIPLGFLAAVIGIYGASQNYWPLLFPVMIFSSFILDASVTLLKRALRGEKIWHAHREHYYQRLVRMGWSHRKLALSAYVLMLICALAGIVVLRRPAYTSIVSLLWAAMFLSIFIVIDWRFSGFKYEI